MFSRPNGCFTRFAPATEVLGAIGLARDDGRPPVAQEQAELLASLLDQTALALERARLEQEAHEFASVRERDRIRATLLSSIRQELGPPVAFVTRAARQLRRGGSGDKELGASLASEALKLSASSRTCLSLRRKPSSTPSPPASCRSTCSSEPSPRHGEEVHLTPKEYSVLAELARHPGRVLSHGHLLRSVWGPAQEGQIEYLRVAIGSLRQKLEVTPSRPSLIINEPGVGYRLVT